MIGPALGFRHYLESRVPGRKLLFPYVTAGVSPNWVSIVQAVIEAGADAVEIGLPFSDPTIDGPTIQRASSQALNRGMTPTRALDELAEVSFKVPLILMSHYNLLLNAPEGFASRLREVGFAAVIIPDLPVTRADEWLPMANANGLSMIQLVARVTSDDRLRMIAAISQGFLYLVSTMGTTGERSKLDPDIERLVKRARRATRLPLMVGFGISRPSHAAAVSKYADGVIVASALMRQVLEGATVRELGKYVASLRDAIDRAETASSSALSQSETGRGADQSNGPP